MSGGHYDYKCFKVQELCDEMEHELRKFRNPGKDDWDPGYSKEHMDLREKFIKHMKNVAEIAHTIEYTDSGDYSADKEIKQLKQFFTINEIKEYEI